jgi:AAA domain/Bifunctional DNA primase/polymerase, N-terminal
VTIAQAAERYIRLGLLPIPIPLRQKAPVLENWTALRLTKDDIPAHFSETRSNIGLLLGDEYGVTDVDVDAPEAVAIAWDFLPDTGMIFGRKSKPASHFFYRSDPPVVAKRFTDPINNECLVELRGQKKDCTAGLQTVVPPSIHPDGEEIRFEPGRDGHPANVQAEVLLAAVAKIAAAALLGRHWPAKGSRNQAFIALAGVLARAGWSLEDAIAFNSGIYLVSWGTAADLSACRAEVVATYDKHGGGFETTGRATLQGLVDKRAIQKAFQWLGIWQASAPVRDQDAPPPIMFHSGHEASDVVLPVAENMEDLLANDSIRVPELRIQGFLPKQGLVLLGGRPKEGKSWFASQLALSVVTGNALADFLPVSEPGRVHLWALEDHKAITKDKVQKLTRGANPDGLRDLLVFEELALPILRGGDEIIREVLRKQPAELIILDSLFKLTGSEKQSSDISQRDYDVIDRVRRIAIDFKCAVVIVMHTKKGARGGSPVENVLGTSGITAAADAVAELKRTNAKEGKLTIVGRLFAQETYGMAWHDGADRWGWTIEDDGDDAALGETSQEVLTYLEAQGPSKPNTIASALHRTFPSVWHALRRLQDKGKVSRGRDKKWDLRKF